MKPGNYLTHAALSLLFVSGISSGGYMAVQFQVAYSRWFAVPAFLPAGRTIVPREKLAGRWATAWRQPKPMARPRSPKP
jgi:poly(3-hydroxybutyrate) depolymerase